MTDSGTDTFVGVVLTLVAVVAIASAAGGEPAPAPSVEVTPRRSATTISPASVTRASTNIPTGTLFTCTGTVISTDSVALGSGSLTIQVYYSPTNGGRNCALATRSGPVGQRGQLTTSLKFDSYDGRRWPRYAEHRSAAYATRSGAVYLDDTDDKCVRARAKFTPEGGGSPITVSSGAVGCD
jgi:hypothetical protein